MLLTGADSKNITRLQEILEQEREKMRVELPPMDEVDSPSTSIIWATMWYDCYYN